MEKKIIFSINFIPGLVFGMNNGNEYDKNIKNLNINDIINENTINETINIDYIKNKNDQKTDNFDLINNILKKNNINYEEYKILLDTYENKKFDYYYNFKILEKIENDNIIKLKDIEDIVKIKDSKDLIENKIDKDVTFINSVFNNNFFYKFSDNIDLYNVYLVIHTISLILERNLGIKDLIKNSFKKINYKFILSDFNENTLICDKIDEVLNKYNLKSNISTLENWFIYGKIKKGEYNAFVDILNSFFTINYDNKFLNKTNSFLSKFLINRNEIYSILDEFININKYIDKKIFPKNIDMIFITLHEFNHFLLSLIKSLKNNKIQEYIIHKGIDVKMNSQINKEIKEEFIENLKNNENFKDLYKDVNCYINNKFNVEDIYINKVDEKLIKNYTKYSIESCDENSKILKFNFEDFLSDLNYLKNCKNENYEIKNNLNKYLFFKYLYNNSFFIGDEYYLDIKYYNIGTSEEIYSKFLNYYNTFFSENCTSEERKTDEILSFYRFLLFKEYDFKNDKNFDEYLDEYLEEKFYYNFNCKRIKELEKKDYSKLKTITLRVNTLECFADVFAYSNMPFKIQKEMRSLGYWQRNLFEYFSKNLFIKN